MLQLLLIGNDKDQLGKKNALRAFAFQSIKKPWILSSPVTTAITTAYWKYYQNRRYN